MYMSFIRFLILDLQIMSEKAVVTSLWDFVLKKKSVFNSFWSKTNTKKKSKGAVEKVKGCE